MSEVLPNTVVSFIQSLLPESSSFLKELAQECQTEYIPLVEPEVGQFLQVILKLKKAKSILEIGTGIGYSSILLAQALPIEEINITTIEIDEQRFQRACANFEKAGISNRIRAKLGDANEIIPTLKGPFDFIFIDAAKGQYPEFFHKVWPLLTPDGVIIMDNIFLNGWVIDMSWPERRKKTMVCRIRNLLETLKNHPELMTTIIPLGDGLSVSIRRNKE